jgi:hypothetical protein
VAVAEEDRNVAETLPADDAGNTAGEAAGARPEDLGGTVAEEEYADPNTGSDEAGAEAGDARPEDLGEEE